MISLLRRSSLCFLLASALLSSGCAHTQREEASEFIPSTPDTEQEPVLVVGEVTRVSGNQPDPDIEAMLSAYREELKALDEVIATSGQAFDRKDEEIKCWMADLALEMARRHHDATVAVAIMNSGGIRSGFDAGPFQVSTAIRIMPFDNTIVIFDLDKTQMDQLAERLADGGAGFPIAGMVIRRTAQGGLIDYTVGGEAPDPSRRYLVTTSSYLASGGDGMDILAAFPPPHDTGLLFRDGIVEILREQGLRGEPIRAPQDLNRYITVESAK